MSSILNSIWSVLDPFADDSQLPLSTQERYHEVQIVPTQHPHPSDEEQGRQYLYLGRQYDRLDKMPLLEFTIDISNVQIRSLNHTPQYQSLDYYYGCDEHEGCLSAHNTARARRGCKALQWHEGLAGEAETHAVYLASINTLLRSQAGDRGETVDRFNGGVSYNRVVRSWLANRRHHPGEEFDVDGNVGWEYYCKFVH